MKDKNTVSGVIIKGVGGLYEVRPDCVEEQSLISCRAKGAFRHENITPLPGDRVLLSREEASDYVIAEICPRKNSLLRPAMANLTHLFVVVPAAQPAPDTLTADKLISIAEGREIEPVIVITKADLAPDGAAELAGVYETGGFSVFCVSVKSGEGIEELKRYIYSAAGEMTAAFAGVSGAGKSTLMSCIFPGLSLKSGEISRKISRGRHTTRHAQLYPFETEGGTCLIADTPGFSMLDFTRYNFSDPEELPYSFREFVPLLGQCRYTKCTHTKEEGCAVLAQVEGGAIAPSRHKSYVEILAEIKKKPDWQRRREERL